MAAPSPESHTRPHSYMTTHGDPGLQSERDPAAHGTSHAAIAFLTDMRAALSTSDDLETTLQAVARCVASDFAGSCVVDILDQDEETRRMAEAHSDRLTGPTEEAIRPLLPDIGHEEAVLQVVRSGQPLLSADGAVGTNAALLPIGPRAEDTHDTLCMILSVPLVARGRTLGVMTIARSSARPFHPDDLALAEDVAHRIAQVIERARLEEVAQAEIARREHAEARELAAGRAADVALRVRDEFLASVTHDLRTPLTTIKGRAQILRRLAARAGSVGGADILHNVEAIEVAARRMTGLVGELVDLTRLESGRGLQLERTLVNLVALAREIVADYRRATTRHTIRVESPEEEIIGMWDGPRLARVLDNLLANALRYSLDGGDIVVTIGRDGEHSAAIAVQDEGIGIPSADLPYVFDRFRRGANVTDRIAGAGIGLAGAKMLVELHGGTIAAESEEGAGTTVTVRIPFDAD